ncbi:CLUMA_CG004869, isoform B [Clunio marinus]|uniref:CLUMA_CG004869, isoform B n=1 Tax=Clunio marinus TaxID=568069 RepID=A0A1J1HUG1_9DIPT|nr:CLUMA_CG004869, isoform B [Clunio marinus]
MNRDQRTTIYVMSSNQAEGRSIVYASSEENSSGRDESDKIDFLNLQCVVERDKPKAPLSDSALKSRLEAVLLSCRSALFQTKDLTDNYIKQIWGNDVTVHRHHETWERRNIPWLWPDNKPLQKHFRGEIHAHHLKELLETNWTHEKIFEKLGKIYQRFQRIGVGVQIVNKWNNIASMEGTHLLNTEQVNISTKLFKNATEGIHEVLCQIQAIFYDMAIDPKTDMDITPFVMDKFIRLNHWLVYREYENLMDYSHKLLKIMTDRKEFSK